MIDDLTPQAGQLHIDGFDPQEAQKDPGAQDVQEDTGTQEAQRAIIIPADYDPKLDPNSPEFDPELWRAALKTAIPSFNAQMRETARNIQEAATGAIQAAAGIAHTAANTLSAIIQSDAYKAMRETTAAIAAFIETHRAEIDFWHEVAEHYRELTPYIFEVIEDLQQDPQYADLTIDGFMRLAPGNELAHLIIERATQRKAEYEEAEKTIEAVEQAQEELTRVKYSRATDVRTVTDKLANVFYSLNAPSRREPMNGQRQMIPLMYEGNKSKREITLFYDFVYDETTLERYGLSKRFDDFDFFIMSICDNLYSAGNEVVSLSKIYREMGNDNSPNSEQLEPILNSLIKGLTTIITIDNKEVMQAWNKNAGGKYQEIISPVIPVQLGNERFIANGRISDGYVRITSLSPFLRVAMPLGHVTAWDKEILCLYSGRKTRRYYSVLRFLMMQIGWMRNEKAKRKPKILYSSLYEYTGDTGTRKQQLARDMMYRLLDEVFIPSNYVKSYRESATPTPGVVLTLCEEPKRIAGHR